MIGVVGENDRQRRVWQRNPRPLRSTPFRPSTRPRSEGEACFVNGDVSTNLSCSRPGLSGKTSGPRPGAKCRGGDPGTVKLLSLASFLAHHGSTGNESRRVCLLCCSSVITQKLRGCSGGRQAGVRLMLRGRGYHEDSKVKLLEPLSPTQIRPGSLAVAYALGP